MRQTLTRELLAEKLGGRQRDTLGLLLLLTGAMLLLLGLMPPLIALLLPAILLGVAGVGLLGGGLRRLKRLRDRQRQITEERYRIYTARCRGRQETERCLCFRSPITGKPMTARASEEAYARARSGQLWYLVYLPHAQKPALILPAEDWTLSPSLRGVVPYREEPEESLLPAEMGAKEPNDPR